MTARQVFPEATLETARLLLRPYRAEDAPDVALACRDSLTQRWLPLPNPYTDADALAWCAAPGNVASQRVAEKAGFTREGVARNAGFTNHGRVDLVVFSIIRSELASADA